MRLSRYVVRARSHSDDAATILFNIRTGKGVRIEGQNYLTFKQIQERTDLQDALQSMDMLAGEDEASSVLTQYEQHRQEKPFHLVILPHENCNFRCTYCYESFERNKMSESVRQGLKRMALKKLDELNPKIFSVSWFGGEPLLASDVIEELSDYFMNLCKERGIQYVATITTNGYGLNPDTVNMLIRNRVVLFQVTIDGTPEHHDKQRKLIGGQGTYQRIVSNLQAMKGTNHRFQVMLRMNVGPENISDADAHIRNMKSLFGDDRRFSLYFHNIGKWGGTNDDNFRVCSENVTQFLTERSIDIGMKSMSLFEFIRPNQTCYAASPSSFVIGTDGRIYKCTVALNDRRNHVGQLLPNGDMLIDSQLMSLWTESGVHDKACGNCFFAPSCHGDVCPWVRISEEKRPCPDWKHKVSEYVAVMEREGHAFERLDERA